MRVDELITTLRKVTNTVKIAPFVIAFFYMLTILGYMYMPEVVICMLDTMLYFSPASVILMLILSKQVHLCAWHRLECVLPVICMIPSAIDILICPLSEIATYVNAITLSVILLLSLINAYFVFIKPVVRRK